MDGPGPAIGLPGAIFTRPAAKFALPRALRYKCGLLRPSQQCQAGGVVRMRGSTWRGRAIVRLGGMRRTGLPRRTALSLLVLLFLTVGVVLPSGALTAVRADTIALTVSGTLLYPDGTPAAGASIGLSPVEGGSGPTTSSAENGGYTLAVTPGVYDLSVSVVGPPDSIAGLPGLEFTTDTSLDLTLPLKHVTIRVLDENGDPVVGARVSTGGTAGPGVIWDPDLPAGYATTYGSLTTDASGEATGWMAPTTQPDFLYTFTVTPAEGDTTHALTYLRDVEITEDVTLTIELPLALTVSGTLLYPDGTPAAGASIGLSPVEGGSGPTTSSAENGGYTLAVTPGVYDLSVSVVGPPDSIAGLPGLEFTTDTSLDLTLPLKHVTIRVLDENGDPVVGARVSTGGTAGPGVIWDPDLPAGYATTYGSLTTDASGEATGWMAPTTQPDFLYTFTVTPAEGSPNTAPVYLRAVSITRDTTLTVRTATTNVGSVQTVQPADDLAVTYAEVTEAGVTAATESVEAPLSLDSVFQLVGGTYVELSTSATVEGAITVAMSYDPTGLSLAEQQALKLMHLDEGVWVDATTWVDTEAHVVYGSVTHFSWFGLCSTPSVPVTHTVSAMIRGGHGQVAPAFQTVSAGETATVDIVPDSGYHIDYVTVDGRKVEPSNRLRLTDVQSDHVILVWFARDRVAPPVVPQSFTIEATVSDGHGLVSPAVQTVSYGGTAFVELVPHPGYHVASISVDGTDVQIANPFALTSIAADHAVVVTFARDPAPDFTDVPRDHIFYDDIMHLANRDIVGGLGNGCFRPSDPVLRAQVAKMLVLAFGLHDAATTNTESPSFSDVTYQGSPYPFDFVEEAALAGIVAGFANRTFGPYKPITRVQLVRMVVRAAGSHLAQPPTEYQTGFRDLNAPDAATIAVARFNGLIDGKSAGVFDPNATATRGQFAKILSNVLEIVASQ